MILSIARPTLFILEKLAKALGVKIADLIAETEEE